MIPSISPTVIAVIAIVVVIVTLASYLVSKLRTVPSDEVLIVVGKSFGKKSSASTNSQYQIYFAGRVFVIPGFQKPFPLSLKQRQVTLNVSGPDKNYINVTVVAQLNYKIAATVADVENAAERFLNHTDDKLDFSIQNSLEGSLRSIIGGMSVQEISSDRLKFQQEILVGAKRELAEQGIQIDVLNIQDIKTPGSIDYLGELAKPEAARALQLAKVAQSASLLVSEQARIDQEQATAEAEKKRAVSQASYETEMATQQAIADAAPRLARAQQDALVAKLEREALVEEALVKEQRLDIDEKKPADARAYAARVDAEGKRDAAKASAEGVAFERVTLAKADKEAEIAGAQAAAAKVELEANADAAATRVKGIAEGESIKAIGVAVAGAEEAKANALAHYTPTALSYVTANNLPAIMESQAQAVAAIDNYTVFGSEGPAGASKHVGLMIAEGIASIKAATGVDLSAAAASFLGAKVGTTSNGEPIDLIIKDSDLTSV